MSSVIDETKLDNYTEHIRKDLLRHGSDALEEAGYTEEAALRCTTLVVDKIIGYWRNAEYARLLERDLRERADAKVSPLRAQIRKLTDESFNTAEVVEAVCALYEAPEDERQGIVDGRLLRVAREAGLT